MDDAYYHLLLMRAGLDDGYDAWLDGYLEAQDPLSEPGFVRVECERSNFLKNAYHSQQKDRRAVAVVDALYRIASVQGDPGDFAIDFWDDYYYL